MRAVIIGVLAWSIVTGGASAAPILSDVQLDQVAGGCVAAGGCDCGGPAICNASALFTGYVSPPFDREAPLPASAQRIISAALVRTIVAP